MDLLASRLANDTASLSGARVVPTSDERNLGMDKFKIYGDLEVGHQLTFSERSWFCRDAIHSGQTATTYVVVDIPVC